LLRRPKNLDQIDIEDKEGTPKTEQDDNIDADIPEYEKKRLANIELQKALFKEHLKKTFLALTNQTKSFPCTKCPAEYTTEKALENHECIQCDICNEYFLKFTSLTKHYSDVHGKRFEVEENISESALPFECNNFECSERFNTYNSLKKHIESVHIPTCNVCNEKYKIRKKPIQFGVTNKHICRPFRCTECLGRFKTESDLRAHSLNDHIRCKYCDKAFHTQIGMKEHKRLHWNSQTGLYDASFHQQPPLKKDLIEQCIICDAKFQDKSELKTHVEDIHAQKPKPKRGGKRVKKLVTRSLNDHSKASRKQYEKVQMILNYHRKKKGK